MNARSLVDTKFSGRAALAMLMCCGLKGRTGYWPQRSFAACDPAVVVGEGGLRISGVDMSVGGGITHQSFCYVFAACEMAGYETLMQRPELLTPHFQTALLQGTDTLHSCAFSFTDQRIKTPQFTASPRDEQSKGWATTSMHRSPSLGRMCTISSG